MDPIKKLISESRARFESEEEERKKLREQLYGGEIEQKNTELIELRKQVKGLEEFLASALGISVEQVRGEAVAEKGNEASSSEKSSKKVPRKNQKSLSRDEKIRKIAELLRGKRDGLSAAKIAEEIGDTYNTVNKHLQEHPEIYLKSGSMRNTRFQLIENPAGSEVVSK